MCDYDCVSSYFCMSSYKCVCVYNCECTYDRVSSYECMISYLISISEAFKTQIQLKLGHHSSILFLICIDIFIQFCQMNFKTFSLKVFFNILSLPPLTSCSSVVGVLVYQPSRQCSNPGGLIHSQLLQGETLKLLPTIQSLFTCLLQSDISFKSLSHSKIKP